MFQSPPRVGLFITCLVNMFRPSVGFASIQLLEQAGCQVEVPAAQTCCGQPGYNTGDYAATKIIARQLILLFSTYDYVVAPSGSCAGMIKEHYPRLFKDEPEWQEKAHRLAEKTWELTSFLVDVCQYKPLSQSTDNKSAMPDNVTTYHDSCAGLRELGIKTQPRSLLESCGITLTEMENTEECCGFGGTFCAKMPEISQRMVDDKLASAEATQAQLLLGGDMGCLLNIAGRATRIQSNIDVRHIAEVLANQLQTPPIGKTSNSTTSKDQGNT